MILLFDLGNTHTHLGLANGRRVVKQTNIPTFTWLDGAAPALVKKFCGRAVICGAALCSVVPRVTPRVKSAVRQHWRLAPLELTPATMTQVGIDYPRPVVVVDFGTAVTFDVVDARGNYTGGIIAPGLAAMTDYLHEKTALLPKIHIREVDAIVGKNTEQAMLIGAVHGYRGLVRELIGELKRELRVQNLPVVATGGYARLMAAKLPEITAVAPDLTLEGLRLVWQSRGQEAPTGENGVIKIH